MIVIASIHQPSTSTLLLFDNVLLLSEGQMAYFGPPGDSIRYFKSLGYPEPQLMSPAEFMASSETRSSLKRKTRFPLITTAHVKRFRLDPSLVPEDADR